MLKDQYEINLLANAAEPGIRNPLRRSDQFPSIIKRFMNNVQWSGSTVIDLGPGHFDFAIEARSRGARVIGLELDPAVVKLGEYRGFDVINCDLREIRFSDILPNKIDGLFCNGSINAYWFHKKDHLQKKYIQDLISVLKPDGWAWISPWNSNHEKDTSDALINTLHVQRETFKSLGFKEIKINKLQRKRYGISTVQMPALLFTKNLKFFSWPW